VKTTFDLSIKQHIHWIIHQQWPWNKISTGVSPFLVNHWIIPICGDLTSIKWRIHHQPAAQPRPWLVASHGFLVSRTSTAWNVSAAKATRCRRVGSESLPAAAGSLWWNHGEPVIWGWKHQPVLGQSCHVDIVFVDLEMEDFSPGFAQSELSSFACVVAKGSLWQGGI